MHGENVAAGILISAVLGAILFCGMEISFTVHASRYCIENGYPNTHQVGMSREFYCAKRDALGADVMLKGDR